MRWRLKHSLPLEPALNFRRMVTYDGRVWSVRELAERCGVSPRTIARRLRKGGDPAFSGHCGRMCEYGAISIERGVAVVDEEKCLDCRKCMNTCPKGIIVEVPYFRAAHIGCMNPLKGKPVTENCRIGCISCGKCARDCPAGAIDNSGGFPVIDYEKCIDCGRCKDNCPRHCIV